jgi:hypothetical protein
MSDSPAPAAPAPSPAPAEAPSVSDALSAGTTTTLDNAGLVLGLWAACALPPQVLGMVVGAGAGLRDREALKAALEAGDWHTLGVVGLVFGVIGHAAAILLASRALRKQALALTDLLVDAITMSVTVGVASVLAGLAMGLGFVALILPGLYLFVRLAFGVCATIVDGRGALAGLSSSWELTRGRFFDALTFLGAMMGLALVAAIALMAAGAVLKIAGSFAGTAGSIASGLVVNAAQFLLSAWGSACMTRYYLDLSTRGPAA